MFEQEADGNPIYAAALEVIASTSALYLCTLLVVAWLRDVGDGA